MLRSEFPWLLVATLLSNASVAHPAIVIEKSIFSSGDALGLLPTRDVAGTLGDPFAGTASAGTLVLSSGLHTPDLREVLSVDLPTTGANVVLAQNRPNPAVSSTTFAFALQSSATVSFSIFDPNGRRVRDLITATLGPGHHRLTWDLTDAKGRRVPVGLYLYRLEAGSNRLVRKLMVLR